MKALYKISNYFLIIFFLFAFPLFISAQETTISGTVSSAEDGSAIPGANVLIKNTSQGTITDIDGNFRIDIPADIENPVLQVSYVGYESKDVRVGDRTFIDVLLSTDVTQLDELVVVGYGAQERRDITAAITSVKAKDIEEVPVMNLCMSSMVYPSDLKV